MKRHDSILLLAIAFFSFLSLAAKAADDDMNDDPGAGPIERRIDPHDDEYLTSIRVTGIGQVSLQTKKPQNPSASGQLTVEYGTGLVSGEIGMAFLTTRTDLAVTDSTGSGKNLHSQTDHYVGIPLLLKINYIEHPQASISLKGGIMPAFSVKDTRALEVGDSAGTKFNMSRSDLFAVAGFTGAAAWTDTTEFVLDGAYERGLTNLDHNGGHHQVVVFGVGVRFDL